MLHLPPLDVHPSHDGSNLHGPEIIIDADTAAGAGATDSAAAVAQGRRHPRGHADDAAVLPVRLGRLPVRSRNLAARIAIFESHYIVHGPLGEFHGEGQRPVPAHRGVFAAEYLVEFLTECTRRQELTRRRGELKGGGPELLCTYRGNGRVLVGVGYHPPPRFHPCDLGHVRGYRLGLLDEHAEREEEE